MFAGVFSRGGAAEQVSARAWLQAMLDTEAALTRACAHAGVIPSAAAEAIGEACSAGCFDVEVIGLDAAGGGNPVIPLVRALRAQVPPEHAEHVHHGATSQDILDTAAMLVARRALAPILDDAAGAAAACVALAEAHRGAVVIGRTLLQQALPTTFALKVCEWLSGIDEARTAVANTAERVLAVQLGGPVGTLAGYDGKGIAVASALARQLGLADPALPWHTVRVRPAALAGSLALLTGALGKAGRDVTLMAQDEVGEARERGGEGRGGSSSMTHKRNPVAAVAVVACAQRVPGLVATIHAAMLQEHERAAGAWHAEWETLSDILRLTGAAAAWGREMLEHLEVDRDRIRANLDAAVARIGLEALDLGAADALVDRALAEHKETP